MTSGSDEAGCLCALALTACPAAVREGRKLVGELLERHAPAELADDAMLVASELIGNAVRVGGRIVLSVHVEADRRVTVRVWDRSPAEPVPGEPGALDEHGRGLLIVQSLSEEWGWTPHPLGGKTVWAALTVRQRRDASPDDVTVQPSLDAVSAVSV